jgi:glycosyltransferase involved in cell wall biosynthesis
MSGIKHTVVLGSYNRPKLIARAITSILDQTHQDFQLLITDDGSNEATLSAIRKLIGRDKRCTLRTVEHEEDTRERADCANRAVQRINDVIPLVSGDVVHYLADDDWYDTRRFEAFNKLFSDPEVVVAYGRLIFVDVSGLPNGRTIYVDRVIDPCNVLDHNQVAHRRLVFEQIPKWADAIDYSSEGHFFRAMSHRWAFHGVDQVVAYKRLHTLCMQVTLEKSTGVRE